MRMRATRAAGFAIHSLAMATMLSPALRAQTAGIPDSSPPTLFLAVGSPAENYLRYAQSLGLTPLTAWTIRPLSSPIIDVLANSSATLGHLRGDRPVHRVGGL